MILIESYLLIDKVNRASQVVFYDNYSDLPQGLVNSSA